ncbi:mediator of RNA polymerase II transcription subunit 8-B-like [Mytilus californianus]|uniref:mediator of RNA polymerase II transcription subunit 8-B-like n=1 Tax=Mytilus californianus TaxID=6549 RepID=UPI0022454F16|nr:mediator of RNA polymerase II transcription subunit 8-B-like [Mytilus californianus]
MQKEEKQLEATVDALIHRVQDIKNSIASFLFKLENEYQTLNWPSVLDNFALISGQLNSLGKVLKNDRSPHLRNHLLLPLALRPDRDAELEKLTEGRVLCFNHEVVPDYLRTKPEPEVEDKVQIVVQKSAAMQADMAQKQLNSMNKITSNLLDIINSNKEELESEANQKAQMAQTYSSTDTSTMVAAMMFGKGLKSIRRQDSQPGMTPQQQQQQQQQKQQAQNIGKAPSTIKTNIKSATSTHPYQRP